MIYRNDVRLPVLSSLTPENSAGSRGPLFTGHWLSAETLHRDGDGDRLESCTRKGRLEGREVVHCFLRKVDRHGNVTDSISFGPDEKGGPDKKASNPLHCDTVRTSISNREWDVIRHVYQNVCANNAFELLQNDCCTCAATALNAIHAAVPEHVIRANNETV